MLIRFSILAMSAIFVSACTTASVPTNPLQSRWNGKGADVFFAAYGPPISDRAGAGGATIYNWRGGFSRGRSCTVELTVNSDYMISTIRAVSDHPDPKGGPSQCERALDAG